MWLIAEKNTSLEQKEQIKVLKKIFEYKLNAEANVVACLYKNPEEISNQNLKLEEFSNNEWKVFYAIAVGIIISEKKNVLDEMTIGFYLEKHPKLKKKYQEYGGYKAIMDVTSYVNVHNLDAYIAEIRKWNVIIELVKHDFPVNDKLSEFADKTAEEIYNQYELFLNHTFANIDLDFKSYDISYNIDELIQTLDTGYAIGLPYHNMPIITNETGGQYLGSITLVGGLSNVGKSTFARTSTIPSIIENKEKLVIMINEEGVDKWQRELLVWVCNNIFKFDLQKHIVRNGSYTNEVKNALHQAAEWIRENTRNHTITVIPFQNYQTDKAIKVIKKYAALGVKYFILDTFKLDTGAVSDHSWLQMQQSMVRIYDVIKPEALNLHILITFQLSKTSAKQRFYTQDNIGLAKNIVDPASTCIMIRDLLDDEYTDEKKELKVYRYEGAGKTKIQVKLKKDKHYQIIFIVKNREGASNAGQIVIEHDLSRNTLKEIGFTNVTIDY